MFSAILEKIGLKEPEKPKNHFKMIVIGDASVGKSTWVRRNATLDYEPTYSPTIGVEVHNIQWHSTEGPLLFTVYDTAGQEKFGGLRDGYYQGSDCVVIMFDVTNVRSLRNARHWTCDCRRVCGKIPEVWVCNKVDIRDHKVTFEDIKEQQATVGVTDSYILISNKSVFNVSEPFEQLARKLLNKPDLRILDKRVRDDGIPPFDLSASVKDATKPVTEKNVQESDNQFRKRPREQTVDDERPRTENTDKKSVCEETNEEKSTQKSEKQSESLSLAHKTIAAAESPADNASVDKKTVSQTNITNEKPGNEQKSEDKPASKPAISSKT